ncbi:ricin-type beta-trefoil lectin domain protein [Streptomyces sp. NPDC020917]|uniref:ricin-type beta-trefoil lectin domain protein n=1 Tax=Streptomyces sp. NPDC020917 TaxID=3365102 RepID=UPI0037A2A408
MTVPTRSADRVRRRGDWRTRLRGARKPAPRPGPGRGTDHGLWTVDRAVRVLATACEQEGRPVPVAHVVVVGAETVWLHLKTPDLRPPAGWTADQDGRIWHAQLRWLQGAGVAESAREPYPRLVSLGHSGKGFVLVNLAHVDGIIGLEGDARQARTLVQEWTRELTTGPWSRGVQVVRVGFRAGGADPAGTTDAASLAEAEAALADLGGGVLLLATAPGGRDRERLARLADDAEGRWSVVAVGRVDHPRWRFALDAGGMVDTGLLDRPVARSLDALPEPETEDEEPEPEPEPAAEADCPTPRAAVRNGPPNARRWIIAACVVAVCAAGTGVGFALSGSSTSSSPRTTQATAPEGGSAGGVVSSPTTGAAPTDTQGGAQPSTGTATAPGSTGDTGSSGGTGPASGPVAALVNPATGKCLSGGAGTDGTPLALAACGGAANEKWALGSDGTIRSKGLCMDAAWGGTAPGTVIQVANCSGNPAQQFSLRGTTVYSKQAGRCLGVVNAGAGIRLAACGKDPSVAFRRD